MSKHTLTFAELRQANIERNKQWDPDGKLDTSFRAMELGGEVGELLNVVKKLVRERLGISGSRTTQAAFEEEAADVQITLDLLCMDAGIDLEEAVRRKFNATSDKLGLSVKLAQPQPPSDAMREALEAIAAEVDDNFAESEFATVTYGKFIKGLRDIARTALAAAKEGKNNG